MKAAWCGGELILQVYFLKYYWDAFVPSTSTVKNLFSDVWGWPLLRRQGPPTTPLIALLYLGAKNEKKKLGLKLALKDSIFLTFTSAGCKQVSGKLNNRDKTNTSNAHSAAEPKENSLSWERLWLCPPAVCPISLLKVSILASCKNSSAAWSLSKAGNELRQHKQVPTAG